MANSANYFGFAPVRHLTGGTIRPSEREILYSYATKIYKGDPVKLADDGTIRLAAAGDRILGIFGGCSWTDSDGTPRFEPRWTAPGATSGSLNAKALVFDDPMIIFAVRSGGTPAQTNVGNLADHVAGTGSDLTGNSGAYLSGTMATSAAGFRILGFDKRADNEVGIYAILEVQIWEHEFSIDEAGTPGV